MIVQTKTKSELKRIIKQQIKTKMICVNLYIFGVDF